MLNPTGSAAPASRDSDNLQWMHVDLLARPASDNPLFTVFLEEVGGTRRMPVVMRKAEADAIAAHLQQMQTSRPLTYAFMAEVVHALGGHVVEARITRTDGQTIYTSAVISGHEGTRVIDARPSDAINLALRCDAAVRVDPSVFEAMGVAAS